MREIITRLFEMYWHCYALMVSIKRHELVDNVLDDMAEAIPGWFSDKMLYQDYEDPPEGDIIYLITSWMGDIFGISDDETGLVERFNGDKEKFIDYLCSFVEESQKDIQRGWDELHQWRGDPRKVQRGNHLKN